MTKPILLSLLVFLPFCFASGAIPTNYPVDGSVVRGTANYRVSIDATLLGSHGIDPLPYGEFVALIEKARKPIPKPRQRLGLVSSQGAPSAYNETPMEAELQAFLRSLSEQIDMGWNAIRLRVNDVWGPSLTVSFVIRIRVKDGTVGVEKCVRPLGHPQEADFSKALSEIRISQIPKPLHDLHVDEVRIMAQMHYMTSAYMESLISSGMFQERVSRDLWPATQSSQAAGSAEGGKH